MPDHPYPATSPDGKVGQICHGQKVLEVKCLHKFQYMSVGNMLNEKDFCLDENLMVNGNQYYTQIQRHVFVTGAVFCDFFV